MSMSFTHAVGYRGICAIKGGSGGSSIASPSELVKLLCTGGNVSLTQDPIMSSGVWGAGYANIAPVSYAFNYLALDGNASFELVSTSWSALKSFGFTDRATMSPIKLLPDGVNGFDGKGLCASLGFDASEGSAVTGNFSFKGDPSGTSIKSGNNTTSKLGVTNGNIPDIAGAKLIAYWDTGMNRGGKSVGELINWSCSYNSDLSFLKCCRRDGKAPIAADYLLCGEMTGEGSFTTFKIMNSFKPTSYHAEEKLQFFVGKRSITIPKALVSSGSTSMTNGSNYVTSEFSFQALGDGKKSIMDMQ